MHVLDLGRKPAISAIDGLVLYQERLAQEVAAWVAQWGEAAVSSCT